MKFETISVRELDNYVNNVNYLIVDLRDIDEYKSGHIKGAVHMEYFNIESNKASLPNNKTIIFYCERGGLSLMAAKKLGAMGYHTMSVIGGIRNYHGKNIK